MSVRRRKRRILKWAGLVVSLLTAAAWALSLRWGFGYRKVFQASMTMLVPTGQNTVAPRTVTFPASSLWNCERGGIGYSDLPAPFEPVQPKGWGVWPVRGREDRPRWLYVGKSMVSDDRFPSIYCPLWIPFLVVALPTAFLWYRDRRIPPGHCQNCGYNLTGNVSGICPECGERVDAQVAPKR
jgi:hypothetical protein